MAGSIDEIIRDETDIVNRLSEEEGARIQMPENSYAIYQLKQSSENMDRAFMPLKYLQEKCIPVRRERYALVYQGALTESDSLDDLYLKFNLYQPADFTGHSLSVGDVVVLQRDGIETAFYVDDIGFSEVPEFLQDREDAG